MINADIYYWLSLSGIKMKKVSMGNLNKIWDRKDGMGKTTHVGVGKSDKTGFEIETSDDIVQGPAG